MPSPLTRALLITPWKKELNFDDAIFSTDMNCRKLAEAKIINHNVAEVGILLRNNHVHTRYLARILQQ